MFWRQNLNFSNAVDFSKQPKHKIFFKTNKTAKVFPPTMASTVKAILNTILTAIQPKEKESSKRSEPEPPIQEEEDFSLPSTRRKRLLFTEPEEFRAWWQSHSGRECDEFTLECLEYALTHQEIKMIKEINSLCGPSILKQTNKHGHNALHIACMENSESLVSMVLGLFTEDDALLKWQVINAPCRGEDKNTPLHFACGGSWNDPEVAEALLKTTEVDVNAQNSDGMTPLHYACLNALPEVVKMLLERGAKVDIKDNIGHVAFDYAFSKTVNIKKILSEVEETRKTRKALK
jgi:hypothetical protein